MAEDSRVDRLYGLYQQDFDRLRTAVTEVNRILGSTRPEKSWMQLMSRAEFEQVLTAETDCPEVRNRWLRRLTLGHEEEFPELRAA